MLPTVPGLALPVTYVGRAPQASPTDGYLHLHLREQKKIIQAALGGGES
jgi:2-oxoglutarate dehydrogenase complex dehydrogenase (E1) component-like enzyme